MSLVDLVPEGVSGTSRAQDQDTRGHKPGTRLTCMDTRGHIGHKIANTPGHTGTHPLRGVPVPSVRAQGTPKKINNEGTER